MANQQQGAKRYQDLYPSGIYRLRIVDNTIDKNPKNDNKFILLNCDVLSIKKGGNGNTLIFPSRRKVKLWCTAASMPYTQKFLDAAGFKGKPQQLHHAHPQHVSLKGFEFDATNEPTKGSDGKTWDNFSSLPVKDSNKWIEKVHAMDDVDMANFDNLFGSASGSSVADQAHKEEGDPVSSIQSPW